ncbi:response regulator [Sulfurimonas sp.]|uniref:response regulator n=1 Tax=Sulfurimonas sp. TaxID=2022749 RepID=UPI002B4A9D6E|nr:response regulator [Sulfurimonas sp.]
MGGTGLGLAISSSYVKDLGGFFRLESEIDKGSDFSFNIPVESVDDTASFKLISNKDIKIAILMDTSNKLSANNIARHLTRIGLDKKQIMAVASPSDYKDDITHLIIFQNKTNASVVTDAVANNIKCLIVEESLFSSTKDDFYHSCEIMSQYTSCVNELYAFINIKEAPKVLIVDDDKINVSLIKTLLDGEFCKTSVTGDGEEALNLLINAQKSENGFSLVYLDNQMPSMSGLEVIKKFRQYENEKQIKPIYAVSISGDILKDEEDTKLFDAFATKPFKKEDIREALYKSS